MIRLVSCLLILLPLCAWSAPPGGDRPASIATAQVTVRNVTPNATFIGLVEPLMEGMVASRVAGVVASVAVEAGSAVTAGDTLAVIDDAEAQEEAKIRRAERDDAQARLEKAQGDLERDNKLHGTNLIPEQRLADRQTDLAVAKAALDKAQAALALAEKNLAWHRVQAPFDAVVIERHVQVGEWVQRGDQVALITDTAHLELKVMVPEQIAARLAPGMAAQVTLAGRQPPTPVTATLRAIIPRSDPTSRNRATWWTLPADKDSVGGQEARILLPAGEVRSMLLVPKDAVSREGGAAFVHVVEGDGQSKRPVRLGETIEDQFQVLEGLTAGMTVVVRGNERLRPGQTVQDPAAKGAP